MDNFEPTRRPASGQDFQPQQAPTGFNQPQIAVPDKQENVIAGIVGAVLGSLIGVVVIVLLDQLGYVAAISGIVMGVCALKGYELLGGRLSRKGVVISLIIMIIMVYVGTRASWSLVLHQQVYTDDSPFTVFRYFDSAVENLKQNGVDITSDFYESLGMQYLFAALGGASTIFTAFRSHK